MSRPRTPAEAARNRLAAASRRGEDPETIARLRLELEQAKVDDWLAAIDEAGRRGVMSAEQRELCGRIFRYGPAPGDVPEAEPEDVTRWAAS